MRLLKFVASLVLAIPEWFFRRTRLYRDINRTAGTAGAFTLKHWILQNVCGFNKDAYWPVHFSSIVSNVNRIKIGIGTAPGLSPGCYIQGINGIEIGDYTVIAPNVGLISADHAVGDLTQHQRTDPIRIGRYCWIGMNAVILPGVTLGDHTVVAAGAVVSKSFPEGYRIIGGVPARVLKTFGAGDVSEKENEHKYLGYFSLEGTSKDDVLKRLNIHVSS